MVCKDSVGPWVHLERRDHWAHLDQEESLAALASGELWVLMEMLEQLE